MADLGGRRIVLLESRMASELAGLVARHGGRPVPAPALREVPSEDGSVPRFLTELQAGRLAVVVFLTGVGAQAVLDTAFALGQAEETLAGLRRTRVVCRGPKPLAVMRAHGVPVALVAPPPHTTQELLAALLSQGWELKGSEVALQHYGQQNQALKEALAAAGARLLEVSPYRWELPHDLAPLRSAIEAIVAGEVDAVCFTSRPQVLHLFQVADSLGLAEALRESLNGRVVAAAVGPVCAQTLEEQGVRASVQPQHARLGHMVLALARYWQEREQGVPGGASARR